MTHTSSVVLVTGYKKIYIPVIGMSRLASGSQFKLARRKLEPGKEAEVRAH